MSADGIVKLSLQQRLVLLENLRQTEVRATSLRVASVVGHLVGTPLNVIVGRAALIRNDPNSPAAAEHARKIEEQVDKLTQRIRRLIEYLNPPRVSSASQSVEALLADAVGLYEPIADSKGVRIVVEQRNVNAAGVEDGMVALVVLSALLGMGIRCAGPEQTVRVEAAADREHVTFDFLLPGFVKPRGRIESMELPDGSDPSNTEHLQVLSVCSAQAERLGGKVSVLDTEHGPVVRFSCRSCTST